MKKRLVVFSITILSFIFNVESQDTSENMPDMIQNIHPSKAIVISIIAIMFAITFLFLAYVKLCRIRRHGLLSQNMNFRSVVTRTGSTDNSSSSSGIDKQVIETLPFFKFSSLKGSKSGLECAVCLCKFEDIEVLRLLPKCKHGFHMNCIDTWLESHSTCPLCRNRVDAGDIKAFFASSISSRFLRVPSNLTQDPNLEIFVQREEEESCESLTTSSSRFNVNKWKRLKHYNYNHRIVISENVVATRSRWSDLNSSDLLSLNCEMMLMSVNNHQIHEAGEKRSMSEIANVARFEDNSNRMKEMEGISNSNGREERMRKMWLPIVNRTLQWYAGGGDTSLTELEHTRCINSNV